MESTSLIDKIAQELEVLESIYSEDGIVEQQPVASEKVLGQVECVFKLQPNTG